MVRGYLADDLPIEKYGSYYYEVKLETGETVFFQTDVDEDLESKFGAAHVMWHDIYLERTSAVGEYIVEGSDVTLTGYDPVYNRYETNVGKKVDAVHLENIIRFVSTLKSNKAEVADFLVDYEITYKEFDDKYFIKNHNGYKTSVSMYIGRMSKKVWGRFYLTYHDDDWIFIDAFGVSNDGLQYRSQKLDFERDNSQTIWETYDGAMSKELLKLTTNISKSKKSIIRFYGSKGTVDYVVPLKQKKELSNMLKLYQLLKSSV
ncbi:hypothetical protein [Maridesulfovibrio frigidus]|uniref:hypothetical protein n=1 Tax=Maridesulfovibrio frigidus TaxID=340956 RepID=UPI0004E23B5B|nr:hypothetical protein [Maridesulfovibrio frigidus]